MHYQAPRPRPFQKMEAKAVLVCYQQSSICIPYLLCCGKSQIFLYHSNPLQPFYPKQLTCLSRAKHSTSPSCALIEPNIYVYLKCLGVWPIPFLGLHYFNYFLLSTSARTQQLDLIGQKPELEHSAVAFVKISLS